MREFFGFLVASFFYFTSLWFLGLALIQFAKREGTVIPFLSIALFLSLLATGELLIALKIV